MTTNPRTGIGYVDIWESTIDLSICCEKEYYHQYQYASNHFALPL